jgi:hypothetical protein
MHDAVCRLPGSVPTNTRQTEYPRDAPLSIGELPGLRLLGASVNKGMKMEGRSSAAPAQKCQPQATNLSQT